MGNLMWNNHFTRLRNKIPGKGTETHHALHTNLLPLELLRNKIPGKGTETLKASYLLLSASLLRNKIPRKGTETLQTCYYTQTVAFIEK